jgi:hypothetical protein
MVDASSHVTLCSVVESTQRVGIWPRLIFVSERTNKRHHHLLLALSAVLSGLGVDLSLSLSFPAVTGGVSWRFAGPFTFQRLWLKVVT